jgi:transposase
MFIDKQVYSRNGRTYRRALLRKGKRVNGKVKLTTIANLSDCTDDELRAIDIALKNTDDLTKLTDLSKKGISSTKIYSVVLCLYQVAKQLGITNIFGKSKHGLHCLWLILSRLISPGSKLAAVRLANIHAGCEVLGIEKLNERDLYESLDWLCENKDNIENQTFRLWEEQNTHRKSNQIFLYDVSSSYFEGVMNELAFFGYNRDKKRGKKIVVYGLLTDENGIPLGIEVFPGNTVDTQTLHKQIEKIKEKYNAQCVTLVGDKGMIKGPQQEEIQSIGFDYITTITKPQIESLLKKGLFQMRLFDKTLYELELPENETKDDEQSYTRFILRCNPIRREEMRCNRYSKIQAVRAKLIQSNQYLEEHSRATVEVQLRNLSEYRDKLKLKEIITFSVDSQDKRKIKLIVDYQQLNDIAKLDGCYVIKTSLTKQTVSKEVVHSRYKDLAFVESAFRIEKSELDIRPIYLRKRERTIAHLMICMYAYRIRLFLAQKWREIDITVEEAVEMLKTIGSNVVHIGKNPKVLMPNPNKECSKLLNQINVKLPNLFEYKNAKVITITNLKKRRKKIKSICCVHFFIRLIVKIRYIVIKH